MGSALGEVTAFASLNGVRELSTARDATARRSAMYSKCFCSRAFNCWTKARSDCSVSPLPCAQKTAHQLHTECWRLRIKFICMLTCSHACWREYARLCLALLARIPPLIANLFQPTPLPFTLIPRARSLSARKCSKDQCAPRHREPAALRARLPMTLAPRLARRRPKHRPLMSQA